MPKGRRRRGRSEFGVGIPESQESGNLWKWIVLAQVRFVVIVMWLEEHRPLAYVQVKDGSEMRGLQSLMRIVRKEVSLIITPCSSSDGVST